MFLGDLHLVLNIFVILRIEIINVIEYEYRYD